MDSSSPSCSASLNIVAPPGVPSTPLPAWLRQSRAFRHEASRLQTYKILKTADQIEGRVLTFSQMTRRRDWWDIHVRPSTWPPLELPVLNSSRPYRPCSPSNSCRRPTIDREDRGTMDVRLNANAGRLGHRGGRRGLGGGVEGV